jgi:hypothetical protein
MPRYFFHVMDGHASIDAEGTELNGIREARAQAVQTAGQILCEKGARFWDGTEWRMTVCNASGATLFSIDFSARAYGEQA